MNKVSLKMMLPGVTSFLSLTTEHYLLAVISVMVLLFLVASERECRGRENFWIYVLCGFSAIPANIEAAYRISLMLEGFLFHGKLSGVLMFVLILALLFNLEEMVMGIIGRVIWKKQKIVKINAL